MKRLFGGLGFIYAFQLTMLSVESGVWDRNNLANSFKMTGCDLYTTYKVDCVGGSLWILDGLFGFDLNTMLSLLEKMIGTV